LSPSRSLATLVASNPLCGIEANPQSSPKMIAGANYHRATRRAPNLPQPGTPTVRCLDLHSPQGCQPRWFICSVGRNLELRTRRLRTSTRNTKNTVGLYWFGPPESKTLCPVLDCIDVDDLGRLAITWPPGSALPALYCIG
jgi:hypothetical protein